jgi:hypothetical protein
MLIVVYLHLGQNLGKVFVRNLFTEIEKMKDSLPAGIVSANVGNAPTLSADFCRSE